MQLIKKTVKGNSYWYLVQKGRKNGVVTNIKTVYIGTADRLASLLAEQAEAPFPCFFESWEVGASAALCSQVQQLDLVRLLDDACPARRSDAALSYGQLITVLSLQHALAPIPLRSQDQLRTWYESCGVQEFLPMDSTGLDARRVDEALGHLRATDLDRMEAELVAKVIKTYNVSCEVLAFDTSNFDSYTKSTNSSQLLRRGHAKSKRANLRVLGLGLLVTSDDDGLPLMWFVYPGNHPDVRSFKSFLSRLKKRQTKLGIGKGSTLVCDGGNICKEVIEKIENDPSLHLIARLPNGHAPEADSISTFELPVVSGFKGIVKAKKLTTSVYGKRRTVVAVYSENMHESQLPGLHRDIKKAEKDLETLRSRLVRQAEGKGRGKPIKQTAVQSRVDIALSRQHMANLFTIEIGGNIDAPNLSFKFNEAELKNLEALRLGRTVIITDRDEWSVEDIVKSLREQSEVEFAFRQLKDPQWASATPLRHWTDPMLRIHAFTSVLSLLLSKLVVRQLRIQGVNTNICEALYELSSVRKARLFFGSKASPSLKRKGREQTIPTKPTALQAKMLHSLGIENIVGLGPT